MVTAMDAYSVAWNIVYDKRSLILSRLDNAGLLKLQNETVAMLTTELNAATAMYNIEKIKCDLLDSEQLKLNIQVINQDNIINALNDKITKVQTCDVNIFN